MNTLPNDFLNTFARQSVSWLTLPFLPDDVLSQVSKDVMWINVDSIASHSEIGEKQTIQLKAGGEVTGTILWELIHPDKNITVVALKKTV